jgi:hypothetical protein
MADAPHILAAIGSVMDEVRSIGKSGQMRGGGQSYKFRKWDDIQDELGEAFRRHGVMIQATNLGATYHVADPVPKFRNGKQDGVTVWTTCRIEKRYTFTSLGDGSTLITEGYGEGKDTSDKATSKAETMCAKYALSTAFMIATGDKDPDAERPGDDDWFGDKPSPEPQVGQQQGDPESGHYSAKPPVRHPEPQEQEAPAPEVDEEARRYATAQWYLEAMRQPGVTLERITGMIGTAKERGLLGYEIEGAALRYHFAAAGSTLGQFDQEVERTMREVEPSYARGETDG